MRHAATVAATVVILLVAGPAPAFASASTASADAVFAVNGTSTSISTATPTPTSISTATPTPTSISTATPTPIPTSTASPTPKPTSTASPTPTSTSTATPTPTTTPTPTATPPGDRTGANAADSAREPPEDKIAAGLLDGRDVPGPGRAAGGAAASGPTTARVERVDVVIETAPEAAAAVARRVRGNAGTVALRHGRFVQASLPRSALTAVADTPAVARIRRPRQPVTQEIGQGSVVSEGLSNMNVSAAHEAGHYGDDVTVAVVDLDPGFDASNPEIADNVVDTYDPGGSFGATSGAHGTAVSEVVVDTAPDVSLVLIEVETEVELYDAMAYIRENTSADVAVMSLSWYNVGPMDGSGRFNDEFERSAADGTVWSVSAGNTADGEHWDGAWRDGDDDGWLNVGDGQELMTVSGGGNVYLQWNDWPRSEQNLDLYLFDSRSDFPNDPTYVSDNVQDGTWDPTEAVGTADSTDYVAIKRESGSEALDLTVFATSGTLSPSTESQSVTNPTTDAVLTVGATYYGTDGVEFFSSRGPTLDGRIKPDVVAPDGVSTSVYGSFYGTSAAAPHAGGALALALDKNGSLRPADAIDLLESTANETAVDGTEPNNDAGHGLVDAGVAVASTGNSETTPPLLSGATAVDLGDVDGTVGALDRIELNATATDDDSGIENVTADASDFGAGAVNLTDPDGDDVYNATIAVDADEAAPNGSYAVAVTATDVAGNRNTTTTNALRLAVGDRVAPNVTDFGVRVTGTRTLYASFDSNETLAAINLTVTDLDSGDRVRTLSLADFGSRNGTYSSEAVLDSAGRYRVALVTAADAAGNDGAGGANATVTLVTQDVAVEHLDGPAPDLANLTADVYLTQGSGGLLQVQLRDAADADLANRTDLSDLGVEPNTTLAVNVTVENWTPRLLLGAARNATWNATTVDADTTTINVTAAPADVQYNGTQLDGTDEDWSETDAADFGSNATIDLAVSDLAALDPARRERLDGTMLLADAQEFGRPRYDTGTDALSLYVAAPHLNESGGQNRGLFDAFLPTALIDSWGVSDPESVEVSALGRTARPAESTAGSDGIRLEIPIHYSDGDVRLAPDSTPPSIASPSIADATDGDGTVEDGDRVRVSAAVTDAASGVASVSAGASSFGGGTVSLSDGDGDDVFTGSFAVNGDGIGSDGSQSVSVSASDVAGNAASTSTNALQYDGGGEGGGGGGEGGGGGGGSGDGGAGGGGGGAPPPPTRTATSTATPPPTPEPRVRVTRSKNGASVAVERAGAGHPVSAEFGDATTSPVAGVTGLRLRPSADAANFSVSVTPPARTAADAPALTGATPVGYFRADVDGLADDRISGASLRFVVPESSLPPGATPVRVRLYRHHDGAWRRLETTHLGDGVYEAATPGFSAFAIGVDGAVGGGEAAGSGTVTAGDGSAGGDSGVVADADSAAVAETTAPTPTTGSAGTDTTSGTSGGSTPGFGVAAAVVALLLAAAGARRE